MSEIFKVLIACLASAVIGGLFTFFISVLSQREYFKKEITEGINGHKLICEEKFKAGNRRFQEHGKRLEIIDKKLDTTGENVNWIVGYLRRKPGNQVECGNS